MVSLRQSCTIRLTSLTLIMLASIPGSPLQTCSAAVVSQNDVTSTSESIPEETTPPLPWPTDTTYTFDAEKETIITTPNAPSGDCLLYAGIQYGDPGYSGKNCGFTYPSTETRTLTVNCEGCDKITVSSFLGNCPKGGHHPTSTIMTTPNYKYAYVCATPTPMARVV